MYVRGCLQLFAFSLLPCAASSSAAAAEESSLIKGNSSRAPLLFALESSRCMYVGAVGRSIGGKEEEE